MRYTANGHPEHQELPHNGILRSSKPTSNAASTIKYYCRKAYTTLEPLRCGMPLRHTAKARSAAVPTQKAELPLCPPEARQWTVTATAASQEGAARGPRKGCPIDPGDTLGHRHARSRPGHVEALGDHSEQHSHYKAHADSVIVRVTRSPRQRKPDSRGYFPAKAWANSN
ncbi:hypothetical protein HPB50_018133 [Hyalomma asiaticum]|uniref:Uncharacterized protein n=1 Tax=Hyalomma asiaticum TaxID=266040 RepID=A0ACB7T628_HYAAI|nr:hypothetical protein HPB50_018133 [Hyalomma asiaticum]